MISWKASGLWDITALFRSISEKIWKVDLIQVPFSYYMTESGYIHGTFVSMFCGHP